MCFFPKEGSLSEKRERLIKQWLLFFSGLGGVSYVIVRLIHS